MAPELKSKRAASAVGCASKKFKPNHPLAAKFEVIQKALRKTTDLPNEVQSMLPELLPHSLGESKDKRHSFQNEIVSTIGEMLNMSVQASERDIATLQEQLEDMNAKEASQEREYWKEHDKLEEKESEVQKSTRDLATVAKAFRAAKATLQEARDKQQLEDAELDIISKKKHRLEAAVEDLIPPLTAGPAEGQDAKLMIDELVSLLHEFGFEEGLISALTPALHKAPTERGEFEVLCFQELNDHISRLIANFKTTLSNGEAGKEERALAVATAEQSFNKASAAQIESARLYEDANTSQEECINATNVANEALKDLGRQAKSCKSSLEKAKATLESFTNGPVAVYKELEEFEEPEEHEEHDNTAVEPMKVDESEAA